KRKSRENETSDQQKKHRAYNREYKWKKLAEETAEQRETKLSKQRERMRKRKAKSVLGNIDRNTVIHVISVIRTIIIE
ncbi:1641_t:CDS:1, partial [Funneliformis mosseae]